MLCEYLNLFCSAYLDNSVEYSNLLEEYKEHFMLILTKLQEASLYLKLSECKFNMQQISFVDYIITPNSVEIKLKIDQIIEEWPETLCQCGIQVFLSFTNLFRRFISSFLKIAKPMIDMLKG